MSREEASKSERALPGRPKRDARITEEEIISLVIDLNTKDPVQAVRER